MVIYILNIEKGDYVTRNSYDNDTVFKVINIKNGVYYLKGVEVRLIADAEVTDLRKEENINEDNVIDDIDLSKRKNRELINSKVGIVFQNPDSQIIFGNIKDEFSYITQDEAVIDEVLKYVDMFEYKNNDLYYLSLGQKQRIMIAEVLAKKPQYIIFDEPTTMIDSIGKEKIYKIIQKLKNEGYTIICITNLADEILLADRTIILNNGKIVEQIEKSELIEKSKVFEKYEIKVPTLLELLIKLKNNGIKLDTNKNLTIDSFVEELIIKLKK